MKKIVFKLVAEEDGQVIYTENVSADLMRHIASNYPDDSSGINFYEIAAKHLSTEVREEIAYKEKISERTCEILSNDTSINVIRRLVRNAAFREWANHELIEKFIHMDTEVASSIASEIESYVLADSQKIAQILYQHSDPTVIAALAGSWRAPKKIIRELTDHEDSYIAQQAKRTLA